ncbi:MAG: alpha/beta hydrolase [Campylobacterota bacterium]|nr:alpha/beta hydrolase [Campylobacterota bacterium]
MSKKVLILHGLGGSDYPHWQAWLATQLIEQNYTVSFPALPNRDNPNFDEWMEFLHQEMEHFRPDIVVCHSLANVLWFHFASWYKIDKIEKLMLVSPVRKNLEIEETKSFLPFPIPKDLLAQEVIMVTSDNDEYISVQEAIELQSELNIGLKILEGAGHINADSGYGELSCAVDWIKREVE